MDHSKTFDQPEPAEHPGKTVPGPKPEHQEPMPGYAPPLEPDKHKK